MSETGGGSWSGAKARVSRAQIGQAPSKNTVSGYCVIVGLSMLSSRYGLPHHSI